MAEAAAGQGSVRPRRRASELRVDHQPGAVLHTTPWRETSLIVEVFTRDFGRLPLVARGAKRPTSQFRSLLSPFAPLTLAWSGRGEIKNLVRVEWIGGMPPLRGRALLSAFYANELLVRLMARPIRTSGYSTGIWSCCADSRSSATTRRCARSSSSCCARWAMPYRWTSAAAVSRSTRRRVTASAPKSERTDSGRVRAIQAT